MIFLMQLSTIAKREEELSEMVALFFLQNAIKLVLFSNIKKRKKGKLRFLLIFPKNYPLLLRG